MTNPTHFRTAFFLLVYTQRSKSEIKKSTGYGSVNSKRAHPPWVFVILFWKSWKCSMVGPVWPLSSVLFSYDRLVQLTGKQPEKTADIWRRYHWFPRQMTSEKRAQIFHTDDASLLYPGLGSATDWSCRVRNLIQSIRSTTQFWVVTRHRYGISALVSQTSVNGYT